MKNGVVILPRNWVVILNWNQVLTLNWNWVVNITGICTLKVSDKFDNLTHKKSLERKLPRLSIYKAVNY